MSQETEQIKARVDLAEFMSGYLKLVPAGGVNFRALCPFHHEKTPSLMINPARQIWKCFGCGEGGDVFAFLMKMENLEFPEALKILAAKAGVTLSRQNPEANSHKNRLFDICLWAARYWRKVLQESGAAESVRQYLHDRGLTDETMEDFCLGYAVDDWDNLIRFLLKRGYRESEIFQAGLAVNKTKGSGFYDRFRDRAMFPIFDLSGRVAGFGGRALKKDEPAKYINSPQSEVYNKSLLLYGLYQAKEAIKQADACVLVEGYMDVIPSHQAGIKNVISISGTALTAEQVKIIKRYTNNLVLALDMDAAGRLAAQKSIDAAWQAEMNVKVASLPFGKDPGECVKNNPEDWQKAIIDAEPAMNYFFRQAFGKYDAAKPENKKMISRALLPEILKLADKLEQDYWLKKLAADLSVSENVLREVAAKAAQTAQAGQERAAFFRRPTGVNAAAGAGQTVGEATSGAAVAVKNAAAKTAPEAAQDQEPTKEIRLFKRLLSLILIFPEHLGQVIDSLVPDYFQDHDLKELYKLIVLFYTKPVDNSDSDLFNFLNGRIEAANLSQKSRDWLNESFLWSQKELDFFDTQSAKTELASLAKIFKNNYLENKIVALEKDLSLAEAQKDESRIELIYRELNELIKQKNF